MISVDEAQRIILEHAHPGGSERVALPQALDRILAEEVRAPRDLPPWNNSAMDGYAVRWEDLRAASPKTPVTLDVIEEITAGSLPRRTVGPSQAARIMTGAPLPEGADAVVPKEETTEDESGVQVRTAVEKGAYVRTRGMDVTAGSLLLEPGTTLRPAEIGILASAGRGMVSVYRRPRVAILATGNELADLDEPLGPEKIMNANSYALAAQAAEAGAQPVLIGIARDTPEDLRQKLSDARSLLGDGDVIVSSGGVSVGKYDFVKEVYRELGIQIRFWRVAMKPGSPFAFGTAGGRLVFGLPGNPVSSMVTFELFVRPALRKISGAHAWHRPFLQARLGEDLRKAAGKSHFLRGWLEFEDGSPTVRPARKQDSAALSSMLNANALIILPEGRTDFRAGETVKVQLLWL